MKSVVVSFLKTAFTHEFTAFSVLQLVQEAGELVLIPPGMWHQVYHLEPSIAVASQYLNSCNKQRVFRHILQWCSGSRPFSGKVTAIKSDKSLQQEVDLDGVEFGSLSDEEQVLSVLRSGLVLKHGLVNGKKLFSKLLESDDS